MAPFKLKFRMGSSRSTSQEVDTDQHGANQSLLNNSNIGIGASSSTLDSTDCTSLGSLANDKRSLLPNTSNNDKTSYLNPAIAQNINNSIPNTPPPSYEHVLEENRLANLDRNSILPKIGSVEIISSLIQRSSRNTSSEQITQHTTCTDPTCNIVNDNQNDIEDDDEDNRKESIDSTECLLSTKMTTPSSHENILECTGSCDPLFASSNRDENECNEEEQYSMEMKQQQQQSPETSSHHNDDNNDDNNEDEENQQECQSSSGEDDGNYQNDWNSNQNQNYQQQTSEVISNKSSKQIYKAVAKQWGITCKMSDQCRCVECQSGYFDCEFDENDHQKTDGGLGAGTPMFLEVIHGTTCTIL